MHSPHVSKSTFTATNTNTTTTVTVSKVSQPESAAGQRQQGSFIGLLATLHTPESTRIPSTCYQQDELGLLSEISTTQIAPFEALATDLAVTFDGDSNEPSRSQKSSQPVDDVPIVREEPSPDPTHKWIMKSGDKRRPFQCDHEGCGKKYTKRALLRVHLVRHTRDSQYRCYAGDCAGTIRYRDKRGLARHVQSNHTFESPYQCEICKQWYRRPDYLKYHRKRVHSIEMEKKSPKRRSISKSSSATTTTANTADTRTITSGNSQSESAAGQHQQGSFVGLSTTVHTPEANRISSTYYQQDELRLLSDMGVSDINALQTNPFEVLATHQSVTFEDQNQFQEQEQPDEFPLPFDELLQPVDDFDLMASEDPDDVNLPILPNNNDERISNRTTISIPEQEILPSINNHFQRALTGIEPEAVGITGYTKLPSSQHQAYKRPETDKWIILTGDKKRPFKCGYKGCDKRYTRKHDLRLHFVKHTGDSPYKCYMGACNGRIAFCKQQELTWHIRSEHTFERPYQCEVCNRRFIHSHHLRVHRRRVHSIDDETTSPKRKKK